MRPFTLIGLEGPTFWRHVLLALVAALGGAPGEGQLIQQAASYGAALP